MPKRNLIWMGALLAAAVVTLWVTRNQPVLVHSVDLGEFGSVAQAYRLIRDKYYLAIDTQDLCRGAVDGMVGALDPYSSYIRPEKVARFSRRVEGREYGLGMQVDVVAGEVKVVGVHANSPAQEAGIAVGDRILAIGGVETEEPDLAEVRRLLDDRMGGTTALVILHPDGARTTVTLRREEFPLETVEGLYRDGAGRWVYLVDSGKDIAYIRIREFGEDTVEQFRAALRELTGLKGLLLDVRGNPGGLLPRAVEISNMFLRRGLIVTVMGRKGKLVRHMAHADGTYPAIPTAVLADEETASAAEILAGSLRVHGRAVVVGWRTMGKGYGQHPFRLSGSLGAIHLTTSEFFIEEDVPITRHADSEIWGIEPHVKVELPTWRQKELLRLRRQAVAMPRRLPATLPATAAATQPRKALQAKFLELDPQLARAVQLLRKPREVQRILNQAAREAKAAAKLRAKRRAGD